MKTKNIILPLIFLAVAFSCGSGIKSAEAKKTKRNYKTANFFSVSGDQTNAEATAGTTMAGYEYRYFFDKIAVPGLKVSDPVPLRLFGENGGSWLTYPDGSWSSRSNYSITDGYLYLQYGSGVKLTDWTYSFPFLGNYKLFTYYGGKSAKKTKRSCAQVFDVSVSGDNTNADTSAYYSYAPGVIYYYRKIPINNLRAASLPDCQVYKKDTYNPALESESWTSSGFSLFSDGYAWITYGVSINGTYSNLYGTNENTYRICFPEKVKKSKNHSKRYTFTVSGDETNADASTTRYSTEYYYRKVAVPGIKKDDQLNMRLVKKTSFAPSNLPDDTWIGGLYYIEDGFIYVNYGYKSTTTGTYTDSGTDDYRLFVYK